MIFSTLFESLPESVQKVVREVAHVAKPKKIILFGSRARGDARQNSDFDIAVSERSCSADEWNRFVVNLEQEALTLYKIDLVELEKLGDDYQKNISTEGKTLYESG